MKTVARQLMRHRLLLLNCFRAKGQFSSDVVDGFNNKEKLTVRISYGFRTHQAVEVALYHTLGVLPALKITHESF